MVSICFPSKSSDIDAAKTRCGLVRLHSILRYGKASYLSLPHASLISLVF